MASKNIPAPGFSDDDGTADPRLAAALTAWAADRSAEDRVLAALPAARLLVPVVAVLGEVETGPDGLAREKTSDMAVPTIEAPDGRRALPAFTSVASLARWRADARPVAVPLGQALRALAHEQAGTLLIDLAGPVTYELTGPALHALAAGRDRLDPLTDPLVADAVRAVLAAQDGVLRAHLAPPRPAAGPGERPADGTLCLVPAPDADPAGVARAVATALAGHQELRARLSRGLELAVVPAGVALPGTPLYTR
ncbi:SseB family protein [Streptomyces sp. SL13]|uniref:SseB family protein n=1 Tax=Streptantibioticus silvisoli TaxID=2705255 RepID=A0AA90KBP8_9ACTN|nr:SseB family protein [Streptantibioticus silvisoli]MDI5973617.1 SseB family protein [Streptantibioticus silvisoli]